MVFVIFPTFQLSNLPPLYISGDAIDITDAYACSGSHNPITLVEEYANTMYDVCMFVETIDVTYGANR